LSFPTRRSSDLACDLTTLDDASCKLEIREPRVRAAPDEHDVDGFAFEALTAAEAHVSKGLRVNGIVGGIRNGPRNGHDHPGVRAVRDHRFERGRIDIDFTVELAAGI